jgi:hypothetical protein
MVTMVNVCQVYQTWQVGKSWWPSRTGVALFAGKVIELSGFSSTVELIAVESMDGEKKAHQGI